MKKVFCFFVAIFILISSNISLKAYANESSEEITEINLSNIDYSKIDALVENVLKKSKLPGISLAIVSGNQTKYLSYGYADKTKNVDVFSSTLFEIGSTSKAFTGLGILLLEDQGFLSLDDPVKKYIPWLSVYYKGIYEGKKFDGEVELTISNLLYHTSGFPYQTVADIPVGDSDDMLEKTVKNLANYELDTYPGAQMQYASINYDVLGYIIQVVSGQTYEDFIKENILKPLGLTQTYLFQNEAQDTGLLSQGYKVSFLQVKPYEAPRYRGNTPAGYIISSAGDMARWMKTQMGLIELPEQYQRIIQKSHVGNTTVATQGDYNYAAGWSVNIKGNEIYHYGNNPNFASAIIMQPEDKLGVCVLTNMSAGVEGYLSRNILNILQGLETTKYVEESYRTMDLIASLIFIGSILLGIVSFVLLTIAIIEMILKKRKREKLKGVKVAGILFAIPIMLFYGFCIYYLPNVLFSRYSWHAVNVWGPLSIMHAGIAAFLGGIIFFVYVIYTFNFPKPKEKNYFALIPLSLINGFAGSLTIFTINETFNRNLEYSKELLVYFIFSIAFIGYSNRLFQSKMIVITNDIIYEKRTKMIDKILNSSYQAIEKIGGSRIVAGLHNDVGVYSQLPGMIIGFVQSILTLVFCLGYLYTISPVGFITTLCILLLNCYVGYIVGKISRKYQEKNRDILDIYFEQMNDLIYGFKELMVSKLRKIAFWNEIKKYSKLSTELNKESSVKFLNYGLYNHIMYNAIFGVVVFVLPLIMIGINANDLRQTLFMVFYLLGPFEAVVGIIPTLTGVKVSFRRIKKLIDDLEEVSTGYSQLKPSVNINSDNLNIKLNNVVFSYIVKNEETNEKNIEFTLGPIDFEIKTGEITYITGGNGSGKSTLGKLVTGLYAPQNGEILLNDTKCNMTDLNQCFSAVYSDFYLFKKLYGVDTDTRREEILDLINLMKLDKRVELDENGQFKSLNLSTGQKKRLAYIVSCLDNKPFVLFDEWAAEQDPEFRAYFYNELLPMLKKQGKGVIVITHDDRYFEQADKMIKLECGILV